MTKPEKVLYTAKAHTTGGREGSASRTDDGRLEVKASLPGTPGTGTSPEQPFATGWSACFLSAIKIAAGKRKVALPASVESGKKCGVRGQAGVASRTTGMGKRGYQCRKTSWRPPSRTANRT